MSDGVRGAVFEECLEVNNAVLVYVWREFRGD